METELATGAIAGRLEFLGWQRPWHIGGKDISSQVWKVFDSLKGKPASQSTRLDHYALWGDETSEFDLDHGGTGAGVIIVKREGFGMSNVGHYLEWTMCGLNGREVIFDAVENSFSIRPKPDEDVPTVKRYDDFRGNMCPIPVGAEKTICGMGTKDCCIFLVAGSSGFECAKFSELSRALVDRKAKGEMRADRIGNCRLLPWEPKP